MLPIPAAPLPPISDIPWTDTAEIARSAFGVSLVPDVATAPFAVPTWRSDVRGVGMSVGDEGRIRAGLTQHSYVGAKIGSSDSRIVDTDSFNHRDSCLWISSGASNCESISGHCFGARIAVYNEGAQQFRMNGGTIADSLVGYFGDVKGQGSNQSTFTNVLFQHNMVRDCVFTCTSGHLVNCIVNVQEDVIDWNTIDIPGVITRSTVGKGNAKVGVELNSRCSIRGGVVELEKWHLVDKDTGKDLNTPSGRPCEAIRVMPNSELVVIDTLLVDGQGINGAVGIHIVGPCHGLKIDCMVYGFDQPNSRLLVIDDPAHVTGLDVTFRVKAVKPFSGYVTGSTGSVKIIDTASGKTIPAPQGKAHE